MIWMFIEIVCLLKIIIYHVYACTPFINLTQGLHVDLRILFSLWVIQLKKSKPESDKVTTNKAKQNKQTKQNKTKQNKTKQNKIEQNKTKQNKTKQNKTKQKTEQN